MQQNILCFFANGIFGQISSAAISWPKKLSKVVKALSIQSFSICFGLHCLGQAKANEIKVMTYNIRCGYCESPSSINHWTKRKYLVVQLIKSQSPDIIGLQEAEHFQIRDLVEMLGDYSWYGVGRDDGLEKGESTAVLYRNSRLLELAHKTRWLSETPEKVSKGWDGAFNRTLTAVKLRDKYSLRDFYWINTHLDNIGQIARIESIKFILGFINRETESMPTILTGDFNFRRSFSAYPNISANLLDTQFVSVTPPEGGDQTFNDFGTSKDPANKIDYIFVNKNWGVRTHQILTQIYEGHYPSDHFPIISSVYLNWP